jgi:hypothetical protein
MTKPMTLLCLLAFVVPAAAQQLPPVTEQGKKAANELLFAFDKAGAIKRVKEPLTGQPRIVVADQAKLKEAVRQHR